MEAYTFPDPRVSRFINEHFIPVQFNVKEDLGAPMRYHALWTPASMLQDVDGVEYRRSYGPLNADQFLAEYWLAHGLRFFHSGKFEKAVEVLEEALEHTKDDPLRHPENLYWTGAAKYEATGSVEALMSDFKRLQEMYPDNDWTKKSQQLKIT